MPWFHHTVTHFNTWFWQNLGRILYFVVVDFFPSSHSTPQLLTFDCTCFVNSFWTTALAVRRNQDDVKKILPKQLGVDDQNHLTDDRCLIIFEPVFQWLMTPWVSCLFITFFSLLVDHFSLSCMYSMFKMNLYIFNGVKVMGTVNDVSKLSAFCFLKDLDFVQL